MQYYETGVFNDPELLNRLVEADVDHYGTEIIEKASPWMSLLMSLVPFIILIAAGQLMMRSLNKRMGGAMGNAMTFGKSNAKIYVESTTGIRFSDVAGEDEAKEILQEIVDFLHNPRSIRRLEPPCQKAPAGGPSGNRKDPACEGVAGEANVPFFSISGSEFVEMFGRAWSGQGAGSVPAGQ